MGVLLCFLLSNAYAFIPLNDSLDYTKIYSDDKEWPGCYPPDNLHVIVEADHHLVVWDAAHKHASYEVKFMNDSRKSVMQEKTISVNYITIDNKLIPHDDQSYVKVRSKCRDKNNNTIS